MAFSVALALAAIFSDRCDLRWGRNLSLSVFLALAFFTPTTATRAGFAAAAGDGPAPP